MRTIFLPNLKKIRIQNFTLYPNGLDFQYNFINGVNIVIGGNGMGKTTFVNLIKYSIIGHYKKDFDFTRTYKDRKIEKRVLNPIDYYKNRLDRSIITKDKATITIDFIINENLFTVERCIENIALNSYSINNKKIEGKIISQSKYEDLKDELKTDYLQKKYEDDISKASGLSFDDLIFFVNEILYFGEDHKTILWNDGKSGSDVQNELFNKYFNSPELDKARQEAERQSRYFDSSSRHRSEDIRAIKKVLDKVILEKENKVDGQTLNSKILELNTSIQDLDKQIEKKQSSRKNVDNKILLLNNKINELSLQESNLDKNKKVAENKLFENKWLQLHKNYELYFQSIKTNHICPLCTREVDEKFTEEKIRHSNNCMLCDQEINEVKNDDLDAEFKEINRQLIEEHTKIQNFQKEINENEKNLKELDKDFKILSAKKRELQSELRNLEFSNTKVPKEEVDQLQAFYDEIASLDKLKNDFQEKSRLERIKVIEYSALIEEQIAKETNRFSILFSEFAGEFLGVNCSLTYDDLGIGKRFYPVINGKIRQYEEELSESQRFFVDHSFRMSIMSFFYTKPTFYIVETPDSSLDISYEKNAAKVFMRFLEKDNALILTTNLNNSEFLNHLIELSKNKISVISLLEIGKKSIIQSASNTMLEIYNEIKNKIK
ncbi:AAA family ATPase [Flavobacterium sp. DGU38]|uniref:AAA family ATPase n=1 Tax=Flavobacterium calami TaxID=3139144 RepID=A0ABU9IQ95_9FLAO